MAKRDYEDGLGEKCMDAVRVEYERAKRRRSDVIHPSGRAPIMAKYAARPLFGLAMILEAEGLIARDLQYLKRCERAISAAAMEWAA